jgi:cell division protein FtsW
MATKVQKKFLAQPVNHFYMLLASAAALTFLGVVMVFSASTIHAIDTKGSATSIFLRQLLFVVVSLPIAAYLTKVTVAQWNLLARFAFTISLISLSILLIPGVGKTVKGNTNWIDLRVIDIQPSEFAKFLMILWASRL